MVNWQFDLIMQGSISRVHILKINVRFATNLISVVCEELIESRMMNNFL